MKGYDYDGVITNNILPSPGDVIITGRSCTEGVERTYLDMKRRGIQNIAVYFMPHNWKGLPKLAGLIRTGQWKAHMIDILELEEFFEDEPTQYKSILEHLKGNTKITKVG
ncbi:hypothetical protein LCGC14_3025400 [marine sediment metagenome]|uniref:Uncharacterized protein n=1 Tax=marine sediment metagenome TaxID=412755 RepID=A0A0F8XH49_9ZZZZ